MSVKRRDKQGKILNIFYLSGWILLSFCLTPGGRRFHAEVRHTQDFAPDAAKNTEACRKIQETRGTKKLRKVSNSLCFRRLKVNMTEAGGSDVS